MDVRMTRKTTVVVRVLRGVLYIIKMLGGFPYSWDDTLVPPSPSSTGLIHTNISVTFGNLANKESHRSAGCWAMKRNAPLCQRLCPSLKCVLLHKVWVAVMSILYLVISLTILYGFLKEDNPENLDAGKVLYFVTQKLLVAPLLFLLFHMVARSDRLAILVSQVDTLPSAGQSLQTWASVRTAKGIPLLLTILVSTAITYVFFPIREHTQSLSDQLIQIVTFVGLSQLLFFILMLHNTLLYLLCVVLAAHVRDLRIILENMRENRDVEGVRQVAGPVVCGLWHTQTLLNTYLGPPIMVILVVFIITFITNVYYIFTIKTLGVYSIVYGICDIFNLFYLCCAPGMVHDQLDELRFVMSKWRLETADINIEKELMHLLDLLDSYPNFSIGGYFMLSRARLVDILGFSATYLVVLLQFYVGERLQQE